MKLDAYPHTKMNAKWIKDLSVRPETLKPLEENIRKKLLYIGLVNDFFWEVIPKAQTTKAKINEADYNKLKCFWTAKETKWKGNL